MQFRIHRSSFHFSVHRPKIAGIAAFAILQPT
jgi:hypothetical protein